MSVVSFLFFYRPRHHPDLHSFPTRRSSDLRPRTGDRHDPAQRAQLAPAPWWWDAGGDDSPRYRQDRKSTRLNSSHVSISYAVFCLKKKSKPFYFDDKLSA